MNDTLSFLEFAKNLAKEAGPIMLQYFDADDKDVQIKEDASPVTVADKRINQLVIDRVTAAFPEHGVLAEEGSSHEDRNELWVCDPIDGTRGYTLGVPTAMFSLAFVVDGQPIVAVALDPFQNLLFEAEKGKGARCNGKSIQVSGTSTLIGANIGAISSYKQVKARSQVYDRLVEQKASPLLVPGSVFQSGLVARGRADGQLFPGRSAHDIAAVKLLVEEAGGKVTDLRGQEQRYDRPIYGAIISNGHIHDDLVKLIQNFGPENYVGY